MGTAQSRRDIPAFVVGIGASAGGLEAVTELLGAIPPATGMAYIVVQHLDPTHESLLSELLAKKTTVPVSVAHAGDTVQPDRVYVIPPNAMLTVVDGHIDLKPRPSAPERSRPVDVLFKSLAHANAETAIGVVLSGADSDGSFGIREINHAGGFTFAQDPRSARFPQMPRSAIETGCVGQVLLPQQIASELVRLSRQVSPPESTPESGSRSTLDVPTEGEPAPLRHIFQRLHSAHGVDFTHYKRTTILRRLERRMALRRVESLEEYGGLIDSDPSEISALYHDFLIRVTEFFRDPDSFDALRRYILPVLCEGRSAKQRIRIWVPGCATGEEVYSLAIVLLEYLEDRLPTPPIQIFGTDVSEVALQKARAGVYLANILHEVSAERLEQFFTRHNDEYRIAKEVRDLCLFARQDVTQDPPFSHLDLISCRNLLIYLDDVAQQRVLRTFHYALRPQGMLMFGPAESVGQSSELFEPVDKHARVFRRMPNTGGGSIAQRAGVSDSSALEPAGHSVPLHTEEASLPREADRLLLARFAPASLLVNQALTILQFRGNTGPYLEPAGGPPSFDLRRVVRPELLVQLLPAIEETSTTGVTSRCNASLDGVGEIGIEIIRLTASIGAEAFLILFDAGSRPAIGGRSHAVANVTLPESEKDRRLAQLEREVEGYRDYVRAAIEQHGAIQEELRSAHEEMLSANEEFQSTNEELETSKEELQSTNEELTTTIAELQERNRELAVVNTELSDLRIASDRARSYADIIIETVPAPLAVLDGTQRVLRVNPAFVTDLEVRREEVEGCLLHQADVGRWNTPELRRRLGEVMSGAQAMEDWETTVDLGRGGRRVLSLSARMIPGDPERPDLVLLAFEDVTARANLTAVLVANNERKDDFLAILGHELRHPLTPIAHAVYLLRRGNPDPATVELLATIDTETQRLLRFVNELLDVVRIGRGLIEVRRERLDFVAVVREALHAVRPLIESRQHVLTTAFPAGPIYVNGDSDRLHQVINNLVENAAKYTDPGGQISVTLEQQDNQAVLRVRDSGIGIAADNLAQIFEPFTQLHGALAGASSGLGLGLSVVRRVMELHGGHIEATSSGLAMGSEFVVSLPVVAASDGHHAASRSSVRELPPLLTSRTRKVLIVDDHVEVGQSLARLVRSWGHDVAIVRDGPSALSLAETFLPECAILDLSLPGMNGITLARRLRTMFPPERLYMIALTGYAGAVMREACLAAGFDEHLVKPGDIERLENLLGADRPDSHQIPH